MKKSLCTMIKHSSLLLFVCLKGICIHTKPYAVTKAQPFPLISNWTPAVQLDCDRWCIQWRLYWASLNFLVYAAVSNPGSDQCNSKLHDSRSYTELCKLHDTPLLHNYRTTLSAFVAMSDLVWISIHLSVHRYLFFSCFSLKGQKDVMEEIYLDY